MKKRLTRAGAGALALAVLFGCAGCGKSAAEMYSSAEESKPTVHVEGAGDFSPEDASKIESAMDEAYGKRETVHAVLEMQNDGQDATHIVQGLTEGAIERGFNWEIDVVTCGTDAAAAQTAAQRYRVEITAGEGPDLFLSATLPPDKADPSDPDKPYPSDAKIFPNVEKAMRAKVFLPLDPYLEEAGVDLSRHIGPVIDAGRTEEGLLTAPLLYTVYGLPVVYAAASSDDARAAEDAERYGGDLVTPVTPETFQTLDDYGEEANGYIMSQFANPAATTVSALTALADYETETLCVDADDLLEGYRHFARYWQKPLRTFTYSVSGNSYNGTAGWLDWMSLGMGEKVLRDADTGAFLPIRNRDGGVTARITAWAAINRNSKYPGEASRVIAGIYGEDFQKHGLSKNESDSTISNAYLQNPAFGADAGVLTGLSSPANALLGDLTEQISFAAYFTPLDAELDAMRRMIPDDRTGAEIDEAELEAWAERAVSTMKMMLAE